MTIFIYVKYFFLIFCAVYLCKKLLNIHDSMKFSYLIDVFFSLLISLLISSLESRISHYIVVMTLSICGFITFYYHQALKVSVITSVISVGLSYLLGAAGGTVAFLGKYLLLGITADYFALDFAFYTVTGTLQLLLIKALFSFQRLKRGMPFLQNEKFVNIGIIVSLFVISSALFASNRDLTKPYYEIILILSVVLFLWWLNQLQVTYRERHSANVTERLDQEVAQLTEENKSLRQKNFELSRVIHADNKMIPALELAFREALDGAAFTDPKKEQSVRTTLEFIGAKAAERNLELIQYESAHTGLPPTGVPAVDIAVQAFARRAANQGVDFAFTPLASAKHLTDLFIPANDLHTLLMDLLDNALLAVKHTGRKNMLLNIGIVDDVYFLAVYDSGAAFPTDTIRRMGLERVTSRADDGGSGIGLMTTFDILRNCKASFVLDETIDNSLYAKAVSILFDGRGETRIISDRKEILVLDQDRRDIQFFPGANAVLQA